MLNTTLTDKNDCTCNRSRLNKYTVSFQVDDANSSGKKGDSCLGWDESKKQVRSVGKFVVQLKERLVLLRFDL